MDITDMITDMIPAKVFVPRRWLDQTGAAYLLQVKGDCMTGAGIRNGDLIGVRPQSTACDGDIVVALVSGHRVLKTFRRRGGHDWLVPESPGEAPILADGVTILGVVSAVGDQCRPRDAGASFVSVVQAP